MKEIYYFIADELFEHFPGYVRGVVLFYDVHNQASPPELLDQLREEERCMDQKLSLETIAEHPLIKPWREAYRSFGAKPSEFRSSIEALARRALRKDPLPSINTLVDIGNLLSLRHLVPVGSHAIDVLTQDVSLRYATGNELFTPLGSDIPENPLPGEVIFTEADIVLTRRWTWRQANHTLTLPETRCVEFNIDGLPPVGPKKVERICHEVMDLAGKYCGGRSSFSLLSRENPRLCLTETAT